MIAIHLSKTELIFYPKDLLEWLDQNVGSIISAEPWWFDSDTPAVGHGWRVVKLYQRTGDGAMMTRFFLEFDHDVHFVQFKLSWFL